MSNPTVVLADDHAPTRALVKTVLEQKGFRVVGEAWSGPAAVDLAIEHRPDVCLIDNQMPGGDGIEAIAKLTIRLPDTPCVMLTASDDETDLLSAVRAGAVGYLLKTMNLDRLPDALQGVLDGHAVLPRGLVRTVLRAMRGAPEEGAEEVQVVERSSRRWGC